MNSKVTIDSNQLTVRLFKTETQAIGVMSESGELLSISAYAVHLGATILVHHVGSDNIQQVAPDAEGWARVSFQINAAKDNTEGTTPVRIVASHVHAIGTRTVLVTGMAEEDTVVTTLQTVSTDADECPVLTGFLAAVRFSVGLRKNGHNVHSPQKFRSSVDAAFRTLDGFLPEEQRVTRRGGSRGSEAFRQLEKALVQAYILADTDTRPEMLASKEINQSTAQHLVKEHERLLAPFLGWADDCVTDPKLTEVAMEAADMALRCTLLGGRDSGSYMEKHKGTDLFDMTVAILQCRKLSVEQNFAG